MEQLENNEEVEYLFDTQKKKLTSPLLGSFLGNIAKAKIEKIKELQKAKRAPLIKQRDEKKAKRLELRAELEKMIPLTEEDDEKFGREYQELEELTIFIDEVEAAILSPSLGAFVPEHIKEKLIKDYAITEVQENDEKKPTITKWTELLNQEILEPAKERQRELKWSTDDYSFRSVNLSNIDYHIKKLEAEITELRREIKENKEEELAKKEKIKRIFNSTTRKANQLDVLIRSVLSWTKSDLRRIQGISQGEVLTLQGLKDVKSINKLITDIIDISAAGEDLIKLFQGQEMVLDIIKERSSLEPDITTVELENPKKDEQGLAKTNKRQEVEEARLYKLQQQIDKNSEKYFKPLNKLNELRDSYLTEELSKATAESTFNPFAVQLQQQELDLIDSQRR